MAYVHGIIAMGVESKQKRPTLSWQLDSPCFCYVHPNVRNCSYTNFHGSSSM